MNDLLTMKEAELVCRTYADIETSTLQARVCRALGVVRIAGPRAGETPWQSSATAAGWDGALLPAVLLRAVGHARTVAVERWADPALEPYASIVTCPTKAKPHPVTGGDKTQALVPAPLGKPVGLVRGVLAERVVVSTALDPFLTLKALHTYSGISVRKLYEHLADPVYPLPHYRVGGKILIRRSEFDAWIARYRCVGNPELERIVADALAGLN